MKKLTSLLLVLLLTLSLSLFAGCEKKEGETKDYSNYTSISLNLKFNDDGNVTNNGANIYLKQDGADIDFILKVDYDNSLINNQVDFASDMIKEIYCIDNVLAIKFLGQRDYTIVPLDSYGISSGLITNDVLVQINNFKNALNEFVTKNATSNSSIDFSKNENTISIEDKVNTLFAKVKEYLDLTIGESIIKFANEVLGETITEENIVDAINGIFNDDLKINDLIYGINGIFEECEIEITVKEIIDAIQTQSNITTKQFIDMINDEFGEVVLENAKTNQTIYDYIVEKFGACTINEIVSSINGEEFKLSTIASSLIGVIFPEKPQEINALEGNEQVPYVTIRTIFESLGLGESIDEILDVTFEKLNIQYYLNAKDNKISGFGFGVDVSVNIPSEPVYNCGLILDCSIDYSKPQIEFVIPR